jgi:DNA-binding GntR family transcriptional regulator
MQQKAMERSRKIETISRQLKEDIQNGSFRPYNVLPTRKALADQFGTTPDTISKVIKALEIEVVLIKGKGRTMRVNTPRERITRNDETFRDYMQSQGKPVTVEHLATPGVIEASPALAKWFKVPAGTILIERARREIVDGIVYRYSRKFYRAELVDEETLQKLREDYTFNVRKILQDQKPLARVQERVFSRTITEQAEADIMQAPKGLPVMEQWKINYTAKKEVTFISTVIFNAFYFEKTYDYEPGNEPKLTNFTQVQNN